VNEPISLQTLNQLGVKTHIHCHTGERMPEREQDKWKIETVKREHGLFMQVVLPTPRLL